MSATTAVKASKRPSTAIPAETAPPVAPKAARAVAGTVGTPVRYARGNSKADNAPVSMVAADFPSFAVAFLEDRGARKGQGYITAECGCAPDDAAHRDGSDASRAAIGGPHRCKACVLPRRFIVLDVDKGLTRERLAALCGVLAGFSCVVWETASSTEAEPRCKIIIEVDMPAARADLIAASAAVRGRIDAALVALGYAPMIWDTSADRPEQPCFGPTTGATSYTYGGAAVCLAEVLCDVPLPVEKVASASTSVANDGSGLVVVAERHPDLLGLAGRLAREVRFHGMAEASALVTLSNEVARGRYTRAVPPDEIRRAFAGALAKIDSGAWPAPAPMFPTPGDATAAASSLRVVEVGDLCSAELRPPAHVIAPLVPRGVATLLSGHGGVGKTTLVLILKAHVACGRAFAGFAVEQGRCVFVSLEDDAATVRYTLSLICKAYGLDASTLRRNLIIADGSEGDGSLVVEQSAGGVRRIMPTANMHALRELARGATLIAIDNASDAFDADENSRRQVRTFIRALGLIARENNSGLILLSHIDKAAAKFGAAGNSYSGSTAWHNSVRSRLALVESDGAIELRHEKSNRGKKADPVRLRFDASGVLVPADGAVVECGDDMLLLHSMSAAIARGDVIGTSRVGAGTAFACARTLPGFPAALKAPARFWAALGRLEAAGSIVRENFTNANHKPRQRWAVPAEPPNPPNAGLGG